MPEQTSSAVECAVCGVAFDPTETGGWCTNPECGEWQYIGEEVPEPSRGSDAESAVAAPDLTRSTGDADAAADPDEESLTDADAEDTSPADGTNGESEQTPAIRRIDAAPSDEAADDSASDGTAGAEDAACPSCGTAVDPDDNFCVSCGADLTDDDAATLEACPNCDTRVDADASFCPSCGEDLAAARETLAGASSTSTDLDTAATAVESLDSLVLRCRGQEIPVAAGETVGREVRRVITESGGEEDQAVRVHREHLRFVRADGQFHVVDLGDNPTRLNGRRLSKGDREPVAPGDEIELSGVATLAVEAP